jgi:hypothetical protein
MRHAQLVMGPAGCGVLPLSLSVSVSVSVSVAVTAVPASWNRNLALHASFIRALICGGFCAPVTP